ncbi:MAG: hypothetical protein CMH54_12000 [Myxococcales bacterium]|nr:hypothetical protein [Myxococcales bacterium]
MIHRLPPFLVAILLVGCTYTPPTHVKLVQPETGSFFVEDPVELEFDNPVIAESLAISIWPGERDLEGEIPTDVEPHRSDCQIDSPCSGLAIQLTDDRKRAILEFDPTTLGKPDVPLSIEVQAGLESGSAASTGTSSWFDIQFKPIDDELPPDVDITFDSGHYVVMAQTTSPLPATLTLITDIQVRSDGKTAVAAGEADEIEGAAKTTMDPTELFIDTTDQGFVLHMTAKISLEPEGRFFETDPVEVVIRLGPIIVTLKGVRLTGIVVTNDDTDKDGIEGTLSYTGINLSTNSTTHDYEAGNTTFSAIYIDPDLVPEGAPSVCGDLCGAVPSQCSPPDGFPSIGICP